MIGIISMVIFSTSYVSLQEETDIIDRLWELEQSNVISFNDMEYDVAEKVDFFSCEEAALDVHMPLCL